MFALIRALFTGFLVYFVIRWLFGPNGWNQVSDIFALVSVMTGVLVLFCPT